MTMDYKDRQSVVSFQDTLKAEGVSDSFWLVPGAEPVMICYFPINYEKSVYHTDWVEIPLCEILHNQSEALDKVRAARIIYQNF